MSHENKVIRSVEDPSGLHCVDIFRRPDGRFGFQHCRRDPEDGRGWAVLSASGPEGFGAQAEAWAAAVAHVAWLRAVADEG
ncbi:MAG: hypothetical protein QNJ16_13955 [Rhodobacter sp.]|nr:hypothetical protein [Rhodobacter sp.]